MLLSFFVGRLQVWVRFRHSPPRLAKPEAELSEEALALTHAQRYPILLIEVRGQCPAIPEIPDQPRRRGSISQHPLHLLQLCCVQPSRSAWTLSLGQAGQPVLLELMHPSLHGARRVAQQPPHLRAGHPLCYQEHPMQAVVIARLLGPANLILQSQHDHVGVGDGQGLHASAIPHPSHDTSLLMTLCIDASWPPLAAGVPPMVIRLDGGGSAEPRPSPLRFLSDL
jgi:hypothetical protein